jgi:predicted dehydrogenase
MNITRREFIQTASAAALVSASLPSTLAQAGKKTNLAFAGVAHMHTPGYLDIVKNRADVTLKYVWDHDASRAQKRAAELGVRAVADVNVIWSDPEISGVVICSETNRHSELVMAATAAGKHLFVEKPLGITGKESREMADAIDKAKLLFTTGYFQRADPKHIFLKSEIAKGNFGAITRARGSNCHNGSLGGWFDTEWRWMADPKIAGVGAFGDLGTHKLDILMWLLGDVEAITAQIKPVTKRYGDCDETGEALIRFKNGVIGTLAAGWVDLEDPVQLLISGTEGHAVIIDDKLRYQSNKLPQSDSRKPYTNLPPAPRQPLDQFLDALAGAKDQPLVKPREAAARVVVMEAAYEAARNGTWVKLSPSD